MDIHTDVPLKDRTTMRLGGNARFFVEVQTIDELRGVHEQSLEQKLPIYILGGGSNTVAHDDGFNGIVIHPQFFGFDVIATDTESTTIRVGASENWDATVKRTVDMNLTGIEAMSAVPGTVGAAPVQNIGAYGQDVSEVITSVDVYDTESHDAIVLTPEDCKFSYRNSTFRSDSAGRYIITSVTMRLGKYAPTPPFYKPVTKYLAEQHITSYTPQDIRDAVMAIRFAKLPDPTKKPNSGSFFKNAIIEDWLFAELMNKYPNMPSYNMPSKMHKIPTGWLIEQCGFKGQLLHGIRIHDRNCLVLINESASSYADLEAAQNEIITAVRDRFRITIEREPLLLAS